MSVEWDILEVPAVRWARLLAAEFILFDEFLTLEFTLVDIDSNLSSKVPFAVCCCCYFLIRSCFFPPSRNEKFYTCCDEPYLDISEYQKTPSKSQRNVIILLIINFMRQRQRYRFAFFWLNIHFNASFSAFNITMRRKTLFYTGELENLIEKLAKCLAWLNIPCEMCVHALVRS